MAASHSPLLTASSYAIKESFDSRRPIVDRSEELHYRRVILTMIKPCHPRISPAKPACSSKTPHAFLASSSLARDVTSSASLPWQPVAMCDGKRFTRELWMGREPSTSLSATWSMVSMPKRKETWYTDPRFFPIWRTATRSGTLAVHQTVESWRDYWYRKERCGGTATRQHGRKTSVMGRGARSEVGGLNANV